MDYKTFIAKVSASSGIDPEDCQSLQDTLKELMETSLASGDVLSIPSFGNFEPKKRNERIMSHPSVKGKRLLVPPKLVVSFKPSSILKGKVNEDKENE